MSSGNIPSYNLNTDKRVKLLLNGTPVSSSTAQSQFARPINVVGSGITATEDSAGDKFDLNFPAPNPTGTPSPINGTQWGYFSGFGNSVVSSGTAVPRGSGMFEGWSATNTMTSTIDTTFGAYLNWITAATSGTFVEYTGPANLMRVKSPNFVTFIKIPDISSIRFFIGFANNIPLAVTSTDFLANAYGFGIRFDSAVDSNTFKILNNAGTATSTVTSTGVTLANNGTYNINVFAEGGNDQFGVVINGTNLTYKNSNIPLTTTPIAYTAKFSTQTAAIRNMYLAYIYGTST